MSRYPVPPSSSQGQPLSSVGVYPPAPPGMPSHMASPQTVPPYNVAVASPSQYVQQQGPGPSPPQGHYAHPSPQQQQQMMAAASAGYGQPMMHGMMPPQPVMQQPPQQHPVQAQLPVDEFAVKVKRSFGNFDSCLKAFLHEYTSILQMDDAKLNAQPSDALAQTSQNLVRRYEALLVALDLFESNLRMLQDYSSIQNDFRRLMPSYQAVLEASSHPNHPPTQTAPMIGRPVDPLQHQYLLDTMQTQINSFNALRDFGKKFLESSPSSNAHTSASVK
jgi:hypothetical protein